MDNELRIRQATPQDTGAVSAILLEAAQWLIESGMAMWRAGELEPERVAADVSSGLFYLAEIDGDPAGSLKFQLEDALFWPDAKPGEAAYVHRLAVRRRYAGCGVSTALLRWTVGRTQESGRSYLRLDCDAKRPRLRAVYERFGFRYHSDRDVGPYVVARYQYEVATCAP